MSFLRSFLSFLYKLWFGLAFFGSMILLYPVFKWNLKKRHYTRVFKLECFWSKLLCSLCSIKVEIENEGKTLPSPPYVVCANHSSYIDTVIMFRVIPDYFLFMGKAELLHWPLFRIFFYDMNIAVHRSKPTMAHRAYRKALRAIDNKNCIALFPEGGIPDSAPQLGRFKNGAFKIAIEKQAPILPVTFMNNYEIFGEPSKWHTPAGPGICKVVIHRPIETKGKDHSDLVSLREQTQAIISNSLNGTDSR